MGPVVDVVGHFGTTFSYATVASHVAAELRARGLLGRVVNMDPEWHSSHAHLYAEPHQPASHVIVFTAPYHYMDAYPSLVGCHRSAIFMSPNTDSLSEEHAETCAKFGLAMVPSRWCEETVRNAVPGMEVAIAPLGVSPEYAKTRERRVARLFGRLRRPPHVLHFSTDQFWPGRKGTAELLSAWAQLAKDGRLGAAYLTVHVPPGLQPDVMFRVRDLRLTGSVRVVTTGDRGSSDAPLLALLDEADLVVAPSRCEGFGMMLLASVVAGVPLLCTYATGQVDYLADAQGWLGAPVSHVASMEGEVGVAPLVEPNVLAQTLAVALQPGARRTLIQSPSPSPEWGTWPTAASQWAARIEEWTKETA